MSGDCRSTLTHMTKGRVVKKHFCLGFVPSVSHMQAAELISRGGQAQTEHSNATPGSKDVEHLP